jgi:hypothetical protein
MQRYRPLLSKNKKKLGIAIALLVNYKNFGLYFSNNPLYSSITAVSMVTIIFITMATSCFKSLMSIMYILDT